MRLAARAAASTAFATRRHQWLLSTPSTPRPFFCSTRRRRHHRTVGLRSVSMSADESSDRQPSPYVVTVHAADEQALASARSSLGSTTELSAGGGATATVEFASTDSSSPTSSSSSTFDAALYFSSLGTRTLGRVLLSSPLLPSTQDLVQKANPSASARLLPDGAVCVADEQASGRGRGANLWSSPRGCLMFSLSADVRVPGTRLPFVQYLVSIALVRAARRQLEEGVGRASTAPPSPTSTTSRCSLSESIRIKWPNDVYAARGGGQGQAENRKLAGVLCHSSYVSGGGNNGDCFFRLTAGVGINVNNVPPPGAESLAGLLLASSSPSEGGARAGEAEEKTKLLSREALLASTLTELEPLLDTLSSPAGFTDEMRREYESRWLHTGQVVEVDEGVELMKATGSGLNSPAVVEEQRKRRRARVRITGLSASGFLSAVDEGDGETRYELHPDGNSLDFFEGLVRRKAGA